MNQMLFLPVHPDYAQLICEGTKTVELRRRCPRRISPGEPVAFYATGPVFRLVAVAQLVKIYDMPLANLWSEVHLNAGVDHEAFYSYFAGKEVGFGIEIRNVQRFPEVIALKSLRSRWEGFHPPQGFGYLSDEQAADVMEWLESAFA